MPIGHFTPVSTQGSPWAFMYVFRRNDFPIKVFRFIAVWVHGLGLLYSAKKKCEASDKYEN